ncbi:hypothetical protein [Sinorhizobium alkalisoli]|uniref:Uncharacterized protein n=1 Tax=Sinorhizobium alkalisoli TaxID=1752398 RepID=A0A1E3VFZ7_9HYPH|nr:hypothetical protein [Sinorhizobium alkalisoli]MCA1494635.1 hypothetical protein [Ensifer sp. NBAIM29]MCG5477827.1 hypothetical protein [Sinorhizobium alkalisoli]ODR91796.1 hypothetical protein A8M32_07290 [Sinorhizobium alkalisoli]QFI66220.1 2,4-dienoyl-CoA reductase [NADPH] [Sinorhizobium alkalisoli]
MPPMSNDPLLQPHQLKPLSLGNRIIATARELTYPEDGTPKARLRNLCELVERRESGIDERSKGFTWTCHGASLS